MLIFQITVSFVIAALSGMGVGGGGLFVIYLSLMGDTPQLVHLNRRRIFGTVILLMATAGVAGSLIGTALTPHVSEGLLRKSFGFLLIVGGILSFRRRAETVPQKTK